MGRHQILMTLWHGRMQHLQLGARKRDGRRGGDREGYKGKQEGRALIGGALGSLYITAAAGSQSIARPVVTGRTNVL